MYFYFVT